MVKCMSTEGGLAEGVKLGVGQWKVCRLEVRQQCHCRLVPAGIISAVWARMVMFCLLSIQIAFSVLFSYVIIELADE